jgi:hypothetical protein
MGNPGVRPHPSKLLHLEGHVIHIHYEKLNVLVNVIGPMSSHDHTSRLPKIIHKVSYFPKLWFGFYT